MKKLLIALTLLSSMSSFAASHFYLDASCKVRCDANQVDDNGSIRRIDVEYLYEDFATMKRDAIEKRVKERGLKKCSDVKTNFSKTFKVTYKYSSSSCAFFK